MAVLSPVASDHLIPEKEMQHMFLYLILSGNTLNLLSIISQERKVNLQDMGTWLYQFQNTMTLFQLLFFGHLHFLHVIVD